MERIKGGNSARERTPSMTSIVASPDDCRKQSEICHEQTTHRNQKEAGNLVPEVEDRSFRFLTYFTGHNTISFCERCPGHSIRHAPLDHYNLHSVVHDQTRDHGIGENRKGL